MADDRVPHSAYGDLDFSRCRKVPPASEHYIITVGGEAASERLRAHVLSGSPLTQQSNERKLVAAIEARNLESLREALADPEGIPQARLKVARDLRATLRKEARQQLKLRAATPQLLDSAPGSIPPLAVTLTRRGRQQ